MFDFGIADVHKLPAGDYVQFRTHAAWHRVQEQPWRNV